MSVIVKTKDGQRHVFPDGTTPDQIKAVLVKPAAPADTAQAPPTTMGATSSPLVSMLRAQSQHLPAAAAFLPGFLPGPWGIGLSGLFGAGGEAARQNLMGEEPDPMKMGQIGAREAALTTAGMGLGRGASALGAAAYRGALRPSAPLVERFPNVLQDMMELGLMLKPGVKEKAGRIASEAAERQRVILDAAEQAGTTVPQGPTSAIVGKFRAKVQNSRLRAHEKLKAVDDEIEAFFRDNPGDWTPNEADKLVRELQAELTPAFKAEAQGTHLADIPSRQVTRLYEVIERSVKKSLRKAVPGIQKAKQDTQRGLSAKAGAALAENNMKRGVPARVPALPSQVQGFVPGFLRSPAAWSAAGLALNNPILAALLGQTPRGINELLFTSGQPDTMQTEPPQP